MAVMPLGGEGLASITYSFDGRETCLRGQKKKEMDRFRYFGCCDCTNYT